MHKCTFLHLFVVDFLSILNVCMFDGPTYCEDDLAELVDGEANGLMNIFLSNITSLTTSFEVFRIARSSIDESVGIGIVSVVVVDAFGVCRFRVAGAAGEILLAYVV
ncbi:hypothetical protein Tco_1393922 [Tanacetum coccineum]